MIRSRFSERDKDLTCNAALALELGQVQTAEESAAYDKMWPELIRLYRLAGQPIDAKSQEDQIQ
jgi:hypothetical protein